MTTVTIRDVPISFPFKPYDIQRDYMEKVLECLQTETNGVLESPTGTGKTLSLLCSSLAWLTLEKAKQQAGMRKVFDGPGPGSGPGPDGQKENVVINLWEIPRIIYASRTHSQLTQVMRELKRTSYAHVKASVIGSRDQLCIHPDVSQQTNNSMKIHMCQALVKTRSCHFHTRVERIANGPIQEKNISDIEDLVQGGYKHKFCPFYMTKELMKRADILFLPYNYLLDPKARRAQNLDLNNSVIILDEAHNVEKMCEDSASFQIRSTDIALCIDEVTQVMKHVEKVGTLDLGDKDVDFSAEDLMLVKTMMLNLEKALDEVPIRDSKEGSTYGGKYIFEILKQAGIDDITHTHVSTMLERLIQFLNTTSSENPFQRTGVGLQTLQDLLLIVFQKTTPEFKERINQCYKVHMLLEDMKKRDTVNTWLDKSSVDKNGCRVLSYWCFSPNFGMQMLMDLGVRCVILTSGTLAPLTPLISELGIKIGVRLENPHVVTEKQVCVKILENGPDGVPLNASFQNRDNPKYINSLGMAILNVTRQVPHGLLIFFPSYALLTKCQEQWQISGIWSNLNEVKMIFVEPKTKNVFNSVMNDFYNRVKDSVYKGAIFMAVCRGKVSEGLDFADINGRAVIVTGLPYPPYKDPRVVLKRSYLDVCRQKNPGYLSGNDWYSLEAIRAVNQAIGRVIRHQHDYGAILLLDNRFKNNPIRNQLSLWVRNHIMIMKNFGQVIKETRLFFKNAETLLPKPVTTVSIDNEVRECESVASTSHHTTNDQLKEIDDKNKRVNGSELYNATKRKKIVIVKKTEDTTQSEERETYEYLKMLKKNLDRPLYLKFIEALSIYKNSTDIESFIKFIKEIFEPNPHLRYLIQGLIPYIKEHDKEKFQLFWESAK